MGAARVEPGLKPDILISESTYATTIRDSKRARERDFLKKVHDTVSNGGKVIFSYPYCPQTTCNDEESFVLFSFDTSDDH